MIGIHRVSLVDGQMIDVNGDIDANVECDTLFLRRNTSGSPERGVVCVVPLAMLTAYTFKEYPK